MKITESPLNQSLHEDVNETGEEQNLTPYKSARGLFTKGNKYGQGRPAGSRNKTTELLQSMADGHAADIMHTAIQKAVRGDSLCIKVLLDRLVPKMRDKAVQLDMPLIDTALDAKGALESVIQSVAQGDITPSEGKAVADLVEAYARVSNYETLSKKISDLEKKILDLNEKLV